MRKITHAMLLEHGACKVQADKFLATFGEDGVVPTLALARKHAQSFSWDWAAAYLLSHAQRRLYTEAKAEAWRLYTEAKAEPWRLYKEATAEAFVRAWKAPADAR